MEKINNTPEKAMYDAAREAIEQEFKDAEAKGGAAIRSGKPTPEPQGEATEEELRELVSKIPNL